MRWIIKYSLHYAVPVLLLVWIFSWTISPVFAQHALTQKIVPNTAIGSGNNTSQHLASIAAQLHELQMQLKAVIQQLEMLQKNKPQPGGLSDTQYGTPIFHIWVPHLTASHLTVFTLTNPHET